MISDKLRLRGFRFPSTEATINRQSRNKKQASSITRTQNRPKNGEIFASSIMNKPHHQKPARLTARSSSGDEFRRHGDAPTMDISSISPSGRKWWSQNLGNPDFHAIWACLWLRRSGRATRKQRALTAGRERARRARPCSVTRGGNTVNSCVLDFRLNSRTVLIFTF